MVNWDLARRLAGAAAGSPPPAGPLPGDLRLLGRRAEDAVISYARLQPLSELPAPQEVGRGQWSEANLGLLRDTIAPVTGKLDEKTSQMPGALRAVAGGAVAAELGGVLGWMSRRVLGQYEVALTPGPLSAPPRLLLVGPNLREVAGKLEAPLEDLLAWVMVHEVTHAVQFSSVPWLREHLGGLVAELLASADIDVDTSAALPSSLDDLRALVAGARDGGLITAIAGPERRALLDRIQAAMALVEGHAEHVMDAAGAGLVPDLPSLRAKLDRRRTERSPMAAMIERLLGLEMKLRQYRDGKRFCDAVVELEGIPALNRAWHDPALLPTAAELADPPAWLRRTRPRALPAA